MALLKRDSAARDAKPRDASASASAAAASPLARVMREFEQLVLDFERGLQRSLEDPRAAAQHDARHWCSDDVRRQACRLAISDLSDRYARKHIRRSLNAAESEGKRVEEQLHDLSLAATPHRDNELGIHNGYFRLYSTELFDLLGQPTNLRLGTLRFHKHDTALACDDSQSTGMAVELALNNAFFVADSEETLPYHTFRMPTAPSLQNRGILSRDPDDDGAFPDFDSWLLFTFLGNGCIKLEVPIEMCAHVYGGRLRGRENEEVTFWGFFVDDDIDS
ncbi:uncharacterized protein M421DRAFT_8858 [Didymella exigua CBS 183.55]|uniref:Uncharacterized protein n=1 Tax=Didymella exigua CBS 183.55 TaxID=1150837 RepID=A0A6A5RAS2_9PLEO|nr:uncharacterized protein M421DRAFT_8858 [Didymella exigua CBS 183.55]KAF1924380.1 hypothetical protein M421DRAFT_8858 [Didymella exigua CBS 183.55]